MRSAIYGVCCVWMLLCCDLAGAKRVQLKPGDAAPEWTGLETVEGKKIGLTDFQKAKAIVVVFTCETCPVAKSYETRLAALHRDFQKQGVAMIAVNPNKDAKLESMKSHVEKRKIKYHYLRDASQRVAKSFGATRTPEVFLLDQQRKVAYHGAIDDDLKLSGKPKNHYLRDAITAILDNQQPSPNQVRAVGCAIRWK